MIATGSLQQLNAKTFTSIPMVFNNFSRCPINVGWSGGYENCQLFGGELCENGLHEVCCSPIEKEMHAELSTATSHSSHFTVK